MFSYRHGFHAGNHADVLKHVALLALCDALVAKPAPLFALDTHAGAGLYSLLDEQAQRTGEADGDAAPEPVAQTAAEVVEEHASSLESSEGAEANASEQSSPQDAAGAAGAAASDDEQAPSEPVRAVNAQGLQLMDPKDYRTPSDWRTPVLTIAAILVLALLAVLIIFVIP